MSLLFSQGETRDIGWFPLAIVALMREKIGMRVWALYTPLYLRCRVRTSFFFSFFFGYQMLSSLNLVFTPPMF